MANLISLLAVMPNGLWEKIIFAFSSAFGNFAVAIIILTLCIKLVMLPIDFLNRKSTVKMTEVQTKLAPKLREIQRRYPDKMVQNQKTQELYKKEGFNPGGSCLTMLVVMVLTIGVFFTLFSSLNSMAAYKITNQYEQLQRAYVQEYVEQNYDLAGQNIYQISEEEYLTATGSSIEDTIIQISTSGSPEQINNANQNVKQKYNKVKDSFLWIKNIWLADSPTQKSIPSFESYASLAKLKLKEEEKDEAKQVYNTVMGGLEETQGVNGYFILAVLAGLSAFLYQYLLTKSNKKKSNYYTQGAGDPQAQSGKAMMFILPIIMVVFTLSYNSVFALYIIVGQFFSMATVPLINKLVKLPKKQK